MNRLWLVMLAFLVGMILGPATAASQVPEVELPKAPEVTPPAVPEVTPPSTPKPPATPEVKPPAAPEVKPPTRPEVKPPSAPEVKPPSAPEVKPPAKPEVKPPSKPAVKPPAKPDGKAPAAGDTRAPVRSRGDGRARPGSQPTPRAGRPAGPAASRRAGSQPTARGGRGSRSSPPAAPISAGGSAPAPSTVERRSLALVLRSVDASPSGSPRYEAALRRSVSRFRGCLGELEGQVLDVIELRAGVRSAPVSRVRVARRLEVSLPAAARLERQGLQRLLDASPSGCAGGGSQSRSGTSANAAASAAADASAGAGVSGGPGGADGTPAGGASDPGAEGGVAGTSAEGGTARRESGASPSDEAMLQRIMPGDGPVATAIAAPLGLLTLLALAGGFVAIRARRRREAATGSDAWRAVPDA